MEAQIQLLANHLVESGLQHTFGITGGGSSWDLITALEGLGVHYYPVGHEAAAAIIAGTVARVSGTVSASISIKGPGLANMLPGIVHNYFENNPALSMSESFGTNTPSYRKHKRLNHASLLSSVVKHAISLDQAGDRLSKLLDLARSEVPGPVHLDLCMRDNGDLSPQPARYQGDAPQAERLVEKCMERLTRARTPVLVVGSLSLRRGLGEDLSSLKIPIFTTAAAKGVVDERSAYSAGVFTGDGKELSLEAWVFKDADLVVGIGLRNTEVLSPKPFGRPTLLIDEADSHLAEGFQAETFVRLAAADSVSAFLAALRSTDWGMELVCGLRDRLRRALLVGSWLPAVCFEQLNGLDFPHVLVLDTGSFCTIGEHVWLAGPDRPFVGSSNGRYMGVGIPSAIGAAIGLRGMPVFCVIGDGGMRTYPAEIKLAVQNSLSLCFVLMTDGRYGSIFASSPAGTKSPQAIEIFSPSWLRSVEAMGCAAVKADSEKTFAAAIRSWNREEPLFIEAAFESKAYASMTEQLR